MEKVNAQVCVTKFASNGFPIMKIEEIMPYKGSCCALHYQMNLEKLLNLLPKEICCCAFHCYLEVKRVKRKVELGKNFFICFKFTLLKNIDTLPETL